MLRRSVNRNLRGILEKLPKTLDETYERVLKDINEDSRDHARRLLHCLAVAIRPLRVEELAEILAFDFDGAEGGIPKFRADWRSKDQEWAVLSTCSSLITIADSSDDFFGKCRVVQFSHFSVKEFLVSDRLASTAGDVSQYHIFPGLAHTILAQACLGFLLHLDIPTDKETGKRFPLARYAAEHWVAHAQFEDVASYVKNGMQSLFDPDKHHFMAWVSIYNIDDWILNTPNPVYYAALCGFHGIVERLVISRPQLINTVDGLYEFPVLAALSGKHVPVAELLLRHGGKVDVRGWHGQTLLQTSLDADLFEEEGTADIVPFLLRHGADVNARDFSLSTPLHYALGCGNVEAAQLLLESGADIEARNDQGMTPLYMEMDIMGTDLEDRARDVMQLLLERGANVNAQDNDGATPLLTAAGAYSVDISSTLLEHGADPNMKNKDGKSPLHQLSACASLTYNNSNCCSLARLLLRHGANVNERDKGQTTPLHLAMKARSYAIAKVLLEHDAEPNVANMDGNTPLHLVFKPTPDTRNLPDDAEVLTAGCVRLLLEHGADVNAMDKDHKTPLLLAIQQKMYDITRIFLSRGAEPNVKDDREMTPLHLLIENDFSDDDDIPNLARLLLDLGANVNSQDQNHATPLLLAAERHMDDIAQILIVYGADPNVKNVRGKTPLHLLLERTSSNDHDDINGFLVVERLLLERGADVNAQDENNTTPFHLAYHHRRFEIAQLILNRSNAKADRRMIVGLEGEYNFQIIVAVFHGFIVGAAHTSVQNTGLTAHLHSACYLGKLEMAREALNHGARSNAENIRGETPLHLVSRGQYNSQDHEGGVGIVQLLLERGANVNAQDKDHLTPLHLACYNGKLEIVRALLSHGAGVNAKGILGQTALHLVLDGNRSGRDAIGVVRLLLENGADVNAQDSSETPLHLACNYGKPAIARLLLIHGANANAVNIRRQTPLHMLSLGPYVVDESPSKSPSRLVGLLVNGGADANARDNDNETPLHTAFRNNRFDIVECLFNKGANEDAKNNEGETPIQLAPPQSINSEWLRSKY